MKKYTIIFLIIAFIPGCYTVLKHPEVENKDYSGNVYYGKVNTEDNCGKCHNQRYSEYTSDYDRYNDYYNDGNYVDGNSNYPPRNEWVDYYQIPWWFKPTVSVNTGGGSIQTNNNNGGNKTTSSIPDIRSIGTTRNEVNIPSSTVTRNSGSTTNTTSTPTTTTKKEEPKTSERDNSRTTTSTNSNNSNTSSNSSNTSSDRSNRSTGNDSNNTRNTGSTRGK